MFHKATPHIFLLLFIQFYFTSTISIQLLKILIYYFLDILKIDNLWQFVKLTKLQLDNNIIEKIEGLDALVNLQWLGMLGN